MRPVGDGKKGVLVVGEAPGASEDEVGRPFVGKAGKFLRDTLDEIDIDLDEDAWTTNALICRPPNNATPDAKQIEYCRPNLLNTIDKLKPRVVITLGRSALSSVLEQFWKSDIGPLEKWVGWTMPLEQFWLCPTYHPSYLLRMKNHLLDRLFLETLERAFSIDKDTPKLTNFEERVEILYEEEEIWEAIKELDQTGGWAAVDYETNCIKPEWPKARIYSCAISNGKRTISYPWAGAAIAATGLFLKSKRTRKIASNIKMEERWTRKVFGYGAENWGWDTMLAAHCLDNRTGICSLKFQSLVVMGVPSTAYNQNVAPYLENNKNSPYNRIQEIDLKDLLLYGGIDGLQEHRLAMRQRKQMGYDE